MWASTASIPRKPKSLRVGSRALHCTSVKGQITPKRSDVSAIAPASPPLVGSLVPAVLPT
eukprot:scaffold36314_cov31-Tisochrysis_lutea.AAC.2